MLQGHVTQFALGQVHTHRPWDPQGGLTVGEVAKLPPWFVQLVLSAARAEHRKFLPFSCFQQQLVSDVSGAVGSLLGALAPRQMHPTLDAADPRPDAESGAPRHLRCLCERVRRLEFSNLVRFLDPNLLFQRQDIVETFVNCVFGSHQAEDYQKLANAIERHEHLREVFLGFSGGVGNRE